MSPSSRDFHSKCWRWFVRIACWPFVESSKDAFLLMILLLLQSHFRFAASTSGFSQDWVWTEWFCWADRHLDDATHISRSWSLQTHCWFCESRLHFFNRTWLLSTISSRHRPYCVLWIMNICPPAEVKRLTWLKFKKCSFKKTVTHLFYKLFIYQGQGEGGISKNQAYLKRTKNSFKTL